MMQIREIPEAEVHATAERLATMPAIRCRTETERCYLCGWPIRRGDLYHGRGEIRAHAPCVRQYLLDGEEAKGD